MKENDGTRKVNDKGVITSEVFEFTLGNYHNLVYPLRDVCIESIHIYKDGLESGQGKIYAIPHFKVRHFAVRKSTLPPMQGSKLEKLKLKSCE